jgi:hypothetical protein
LAERISRKDAVSLVNDVALGLAQLDIVGGVTLRELGLSELPHYLASFYVWGRGLSHEVPEPIPKDLVERAKEVLRKKLEEKLAKLKEREGELRESGYNDREIGILESRYNEGYEVAVAALDRLSQTSTG